MLKTNGFKTLGSCGLSDYKEKGKKLVYPDEKPDEKREEKQDRKEKG